MSSYRLIRELNNGTYGVAHLVEHVVSQNRFAMKIQKDLRTDEARLRAS